MGGGDGGGGGDGRMRRGVDDRKGLVGNDSPRDPTALKANHPGPQGSCRHPLLAALSGESKEGCRTGPEQFRLRTHKGPKGCMRGEGVGAKWPRRQQLAP
jgi:hypothetical protein